MREKSDIRVEEKDHIIISEEITEKITTVVTIRDIILIEMKRLQKKLQVKRIINKMAGGWQQSPFVYLKYTWRFQQNVY